MLVTDQDRKYDTLEHFYYLTKVGAEKELGYSISHWNNVEKRLMNQGRRLH